MTHIQNVKDWTSERGNQLLYATAEMLERNDPQRAQCIGHLRRERNSYPQQQTSCEFCLVEEQLLPMNLCEANSPTMVVFHDQESIFNFEF